MMRAYIVLINRKPFNFPDGQEWILSQVRVDYGVHRELGNQLNDGRCDWEACFEGCHIVKTPNSLALRHFQFPSQIGSAGPCFCARRSKPFGLLTLVAAAARGHAANQQPTLHLNKKW